MNYSLFQSNTIITYKQHQQLLNIKEIIIPFSKQSKEINTFIYIPNVAHQQQIIKQIARVLPFYQILQAQITKEQIQVQLDKIDKTEAIALRDRVNHINFGTLEFEVMSIKNEVATIQAQIINQTIRLNKPTKELIKLQTQTYNQTTNNKIAKQGTLYLDCDILEYTSYAEYQIYIMLLIMQLQFAFLTYKIVLLNAIATKAMLVFNMQILYTHIPYLQQTLKENDIIITHSKYSNKANVLDKDLRPITQITQCKCDIAYKQSIKHKQHSDTQIKQILAQSNLGIFNNVIAQIKQIL